MKIFRKRFRIPYSEFVSVCNDIKKHEVFDRWTSTNAFGVKASDILLFLLGTLRYIGRSHTFDDASKSTYISSDVHRVFFMTLLEYGRTVLYEIYIFTPLKTMDSKHVEQLFKITGFNGYYESSDGTHIGLLFCPS